MSNQAQQPDPAPMPAMAQPKIIDPATSRAASEKIQQARLSLILNEPFFASLVLRMEPIENANITNMATNGRHAIYNPVWVQASTKEEIVSTLCALAMHNALGHPWRRESRDMRTWNAATDEVINEILSDAGMPLPAGQYQSGRFNGQPVETIYQTLYEEKGEDDSNGNPEGDGAGAVQDGDGPTQDGDGNNQEQDWQVAMIQAAQAAQSQGGTAPGFIKRIIDEIKHPPLDWREILSAFIVNKAATDYTWTKPNKKFIAHGVYLPTLQDTNMPPVWFVVDTSGSINDEALAKFAVEINSAVDTVQPEHSRVIYFDTRVTNEQVFDKGDEIILNPMGGGGTDFRAPFARMDELIEEGEEPSCVVFITDLECNSWPDQAPNFPVLFVHYDPYDRSNGNYWIDRVPFGEVVSMNT